MEEYERSGGYHTHGRRYSVAVIADLVRTKLVHKLSLEAYLLWLSFITRRRMCLQRMRTCTRRKSLRPAFVPWLGRRWTHPRPRESKGRIAVVTLNINHYVCL